MKVSTLFGLSALTGLGSSFPMFQPLGNLTASIEGGINGGTGIPKYGGMKSYDDGKTPPLPERMSFSQFYNYGYAVTEYVKLNNWIMDNRSNYHAERMGRKSILDGNYFRKEKLEGADRKAIIREATYSMVYIIRNQTFENGNHRTAVLLLIDCLEAAGIHYPGDPLDLYVKTEMTTQLLWRGVDKHIDDLVELIEATTAKTPDMAQNDRERVNIAPADTPRRAYAERMKFADKWYTAEENNESRVRHAREDFEDNQRRVGQDRTEDDVSTLYLVMQEAEQNQNEEREYWRVNPFGGWMNFKGGFYDQLDENGNR